MREKLIELLGGDMCKGSYCEDCEHEHNEKNCIEHIKRKMADHLLANGVTIQKWIPVTERLPEESGAYLVATERDGVFVTHYSKRGQLFSISRLGVAITHWQERPLPPKEGD